MDPRKKLIVVLVLVCLLSGTVAVKAEDASELIGQARPLPDGKSKLPLENVTQGEYSPLPVAGHKISKSLHKKI